MSYLSGQVMNSASILCLSGENSVEKLQVCSHLYLKRKFTITEDLIDRKLIFMEGELFVFLFLFITQLKYFI